MPPSDLDTGEAANEAIEIAMAADSGYVYPTGVAIRTLARTTDRAISLQLAVPRDWREWITEGELHLLSELAESHGWQVRVTECPIDAHGLPRTLHISPMTFMKPALFDVARQKRLLFLDGDIVARADWTPMVESVRLNAVAASFVPDMEDFEHKWLPDLDRRWYINAGILVVRPELWQSRYSELWRQYLRDFDELGFVYLEQDILNAAMLDNVDPLSTVFNSCPAYGDPITDASIVHYAGWFKPWLAVPGEVSSLNSLMLQAFQYYQAAERDFWAHVESSLSPESILAWRSVHRRIRGRFDWKLHYRHKRWKLARLIKRDD